MKLNEINVGEDYLVGHSSRVEVLEARVERTTSTGSKRRDGVRLLVKETATYTSMAVGDEIVTLASHIKRKWSEHQADLEAEENRRQAKLKQHQRSQQQLDKLRASMLKVGIEIDGASVGYFNGPDEPNLNLRISTQNLHKLQALLDALPQGKIQLPEPGSALDNLFG